MAILSPSQVGPAQESTRAPQARTGPGMFRQVSESVGLGLRSHTLVLVWLRSSGGLFVLVGFGFGFVWSWFGSDVHQQESNHNVPPRSLGCHSSGHDLGRGIGPSGSGCLWQRVFEANVAGDQFQSRLPDSTFVFLGV